MALAEGSYFRDLSLDLGNKDMSNPSASASQSAPYRTGDYFTISGRSNSGVGLGKIVVYGGLAMIGYWLFKKIAG